MEDARPVQYGKRKLGQKKWEEQKAKNKLSTRQATVYGKRKMGRMVVKSDAPAPEPRQENPFVDAKGQRVSIAKLEEILEATPGLLDVALEIELSHPDKPRKGAVELLRALEGRRPEGPRESVTKLLETLS